MLEAKPYFPKYIEKFLEDKRIVRGNRDEQQEVPDLIGYAFRFYRYSNNQYEQTFREEAERLAAWARRKGADARVVREVWYTVQEHRKPYYKRDYILLVISDPVAIFIEKRMGKE